MHLLASYVSHAIFRSAAHHKSSALIHEVSSMSSYSLTYDLRSSCLISVFIRVLIISSSISIYENCVYIIYGYDCYVKFTILYFYQKAINDLGFSHPTPIQASTIPVALMGKDICACAATGTGA